jgi:hypothetical protein
LVAVGREGRTPLEAGVGRQRNQHQSRGCRLAPGTGPPTEKEQPGDDLARRSGLGAEDGGQRRGAGVAAKSAVARHHLVQNGAEREDVRARVEPLALGLLRRHVSDGPDQQALRGLEPLVRREREGVAGVRFVRLHELREAEVQHLHATVVTDHDVGGLEVAVDDPRGVGGGERVRRGDGVRERIAQGQAAPPRTP